MPASLTFKAIIVHVTNVGDRGAKSASLGDVLSPTKLSTLKSNEIGAEFSARLKRRVGGGREGGEGGREGGEGGREGKTTETEWSKDCH